MKKETFFFSELSGFDNEYIIVCCRPSCSHHTSVGMTRKHMFDPCSTINSFICFKVLHSWCCKVLQNANFDIKQADKLTNLQRKMVATQCMSL